jgi:integrase
VVRSNIRRNKNNNNNNQRNTKDSLLTAGYAPATKLKYLKAVERFVNFCDGNGLDANTFEELDTALSSYFQFMFDNAGELHCSKSEAQCALFGVVMKLPRAQNELVLARRCLRNWNRQTPSVSYPPITRDLTVIVAANMASRGKLRHAIATLLGFDACLRVGELTSLKRKHVADSGDPRLGSGFTGMAIRLEKTKTGPNQFVRLRDSSVVKLVRTLLKDCPSPESWLFPFTTAQFRYEFKRTVAALGLPDYRPHSLRHGGATHLFVHEGKSIDYIMHVGRWASSKSARRYIQQGRALLMGLTIPPRIAEAAAVLARNPADAITSAFRLALKARR